MCVLVKSVTTNSGISIPSPSPAVSPTVREAGCAVQRALLSAPAGLMKVAPGARYGNSAGSWGVRASPNPTWRGGGGGGGGGGGESVAAPPMLGQPAHTLLNLIIMNISVYGFGYAL